MTRSAGAHGEEIGRVGPFLLTDVLGVGSFATAYRAVDERLGDTVVVKVLAENHSLNPEVRERFIAEGRSLRRVRSPHVVTVYDIGETERQQPYLVLELADRGTLAERVARRRAQGWIASAQDVLAVARPLAAALEAVHSARIVHRDLSPGNVLLATRTTTPRATPPHASAAATDPAGGDSAGTVVADSERVLLADLGMCKDLALGSGLTVAGGTSGFRPPEQREGPAVIDTRADLWALSSVVRWLAEGADLPELDAVLARGLATDPRERQPDVTTWLAEVEAALAPTPVVEPLHPAPRRGYLPPIGSAVLSDTAETTGDAPLPPRSRRRRGVALVALITALALAVGSVAFLAWPSGAPSRSGTSAIAIEGPERIAVGEPATFTAQVTDVATWVWIVPGGGYVTDEESVTISARSAGSAQIVLLARAADGTELRATHRVQVE